MGAMLGTYHSRDVDLKMDDNITYPPTTGFKYSRKKRQAVVSEDSLKSAMIPPKYRDYCAHILLNYQVCRYKHFPLVYRCHHERHDYLNCEHEDYIIRMKEFERERRLRVRDKRLRAIAEEKNKPKPPPPPPPEKKC